jgi:hypothetical protein
LADISELDARTRRFVIQSGDNGDGDEPVFALSRKPEQESVSSVAIVGYQKWPSSFADLINVGRLDIYVALVDAR